MSGGFLNLNEMIIKATKEHVYKAMLADF